MNLHHPTEAGSLEDILHAHSWARVEAQQMIERGNL